MGSLRIGRPRQALLALTVAALLAIPAAPASAAIIVKLAGPGAGTVTSSPAGIECSNVGGGAPGPSCSAEFGNFTIEQLSAAAGGGSLFLSWSGDDPFGAFPFLSPSCNSGSANPCKVANRTGFTVHVTATFGCAPLVAPLATTGEASPGGDFSLRTLEGTVELGNCGLEESYFEYGTTTAYGSTTPTVPAASELKGPATEEVSAETEPLEPETTYHYRLVASNPGGTSRGEDRIFTTGPAPPDNCPNAARRAEQGIKAILLPDCMALEMVSPPHKVGQPAKFPNVSADGSRVSFISQTALGGDTTALPSPLPYVASRGESGWTSETTVPDVSPHLIEQWEPLSQARPSFTPDFSRWLGFGSAVSWQQQGGGIAEAYEAGLGGFFRLLSKPFAPLTGGGRVLFEQGKFQGASADHSHLYFTPRSPSVTYFPGDPEPSLETGEPGNVYLVRTDAGNQPGPLELLQRDRTGKVWGGGCGARLGGIGEVPNASPPNGVRTQGAISADGSRTYFSARAAQSQSSECDIENKLRILERLETPSGPDVFPLFAPECSRPSLPDPPGSCKELSGDDLYQGASLDGSKVYFTTNRQLANSDLDGSSAECSTKVAVAGCDLYLYDSSRPAGHRLVQVSAGEATASHPTVGAEAKVYNGITAISADGSHIYFVATGVLTEDTNPESDTAQEGKPNLYMWNAESEETVFVGTLAAPLENDPGDAILAETEKGLWGGGGTWRNDAYPVPVLSPTEQNGERGEEGGDGHVLVFESRSELTANDGDGRHLDVYRYDATAPSPTLQCLSCAPGSSALKPDAAPFDVEDQSEVQPPGTDFAERHRWVSEDGGEVSFTTSEPLVPGDVNGAEDFYLWRHGGLARLPGTPFLTSEALVSLAPVLSHDGSTVAFTTATPLLPQDGDTTADVYVARVDGGFPRPQAPQICEPGNPDPSKGCQPPPPLVPPSVAAKRLESGNVKPPRRCTKGEVRRHGRCVPGHVHKRHAKRRHRIDPANRGLRVRK
jgi:hypothetical protein